MTDYNCDCYNSMPEYTIELNEQGVQGLTGKDGADGFSPTIEVYSNTATEYILNITNKDGSFNTPNLYGNKEWAEVDLSNVQQPLKVYSTFYNPENENQRISYGVTLGFDGASFNTDGATATAVAYLESYQQLFSPKDNQWVTVGNIKTNLIPEIATSTTAGIVKPDNSTISIDDNGIISVIGGTGGTNNYQNLINKPQINSIELVGNKSLSELGIQPAGNYLVQSDLNDYAKITQIPTNVSQLTNDAGYITSADIDNDSEIARVHNRNCVQIVNWYSNPDSAYLDSNNRWNYDSNIYTDILPISIQPTSFKLHYSYYFPVNAAGRIPVLLQNSNTKNGFKTIPASDKYLGFGLFRGDSELFRIFDANFLPSKDQALNKEYEVEIIVNVVNNGDNTLTLDLNQSTVKQKGSSSVLNTFNGNTVTTTLDIWNECMSSINQISVSNYQRQSNPDEFYLEYNNDITIYPFGKDGIKSTLLLNYDKNVFNINSTNQLTLLNSYALESDLEALQNTVNSQASLIDQLQQKVLALQDTVNSQTALIEALQQRILALETLINGGNSNG